MDLLTYPTGDHEAPQRADGEELQGCVDSGDAAPQRADSAPPLQELLGHSDSELEEEDAPAQGEDQPAAVQLCSKVKR